MTMPLPSNVVVEEVLVPDDPDPPDVVPPLPLFVPPVPPEELPVELAPEVLAAIC
jgi:hypothetical protein